MTKPVHYICAAIIPTLLVVGGVLYATGVYDKMLYAIHHSKFQAWFDSYISFIPRKYATTWGAATGMTVWLVATVGLFAICGYTLHNDKRNDQKPAVS